MINENRLSIGDPLELTVAPGGAAVGQPLRRVPQLSTPEALSSWQLAREAALIGSAAVGAVLIARWGPGSTVLSPEDASTALAVLAGALALATAAMWHVVRWLTGDGRASLGAGAMALYALVAVPTSAIGTVLGAHGAIEIGRLVVHLVVVALLLASSTESMADSRAGSRKLLFAGLLVVLGTVFFGFYDPARALALSEVPTLRWLVVAAWVIAGVRLTRVAVRNGLEPSLRCGLGLTLLAVAHCYRLATELGQPDNTQTLTFTTLRLVALAFVGLGAMEFGKRALQRVRDGARQVELPLAADPHPTADRSTDKERLSAFANEQAARASQVFDDATQAARRIAAFASQPPGAGWLDGLPRLGFALALLVATVAVSRIPIVMTWLLTREVGVALALVAVAGGVLSAFGCGVLGQLGDEPAGLWLCAGLAFYSVIGIPVATYNASSPDSDAAVSNLRFVSNAMFVALTLAAVLVATRPRRDGWVVLSGGLILGLAAAALGVAYPAESLVLSTSPSIRFGLSVCWLMSGVILIGAGGVRRTSWLSWAGIGCTMIAISHAQRASAGSPFIPLGSAFTSVRLLGVLVIVAGVLPAARRVLIEAYTARHRQLAELQEAQTGLQRVAERDHDIRSGLAVLANANVLLQSRLRPQEERDVLQAAVNAELSRLKVLLRPSGVGDGEDAAYDYELADVIDERMTLQTSAEMDVRVDIEPHLWVHGNPLVLAQVLANVLTNWQRHASGSPLRIQAMRHNEYVVLRVCDFGPGIPAHLENKVFDLAVRGAASSGQGFGLHICRRLLEAESGKIHIQQRQGNGTGCTVVIELLAAETDGPRHTELCNRLIG